MILTIAAQRAALAARTISAVELAQDALARIARFDRAPFISVQAEFALAQAAAVDAGTVAGPLAGVTLAHKDMYDRAGFMTGYGAKPGTGRLATVTAPVLARLDAAGQVDLGRLMMSEYALGPTGHNAHHGLPPNATVPGAITGGSSSGSGSAVAAGLVAGALGSDTGGSIRLPAACCGVVGFKPTQGRVPLSHVMPLSPTQDCVGPLAGSVADAVLLLRLISGPDGEDATCRAMPWVEDVAPLRVGFDNGAFLRGLAPATVTAVEEARRMVAAVDMDLGFFDHLAEPASVIAMSEASAIHANRLATAAHVYGPQVRARLVQAAVIPAQAYLRALQIRTEAIRRINAIFETVDLLVIPTLPGTPPMDASTNVADSPNFNATINEMTRLTRPASILGLPCISLPVMRTDKGPISLQIMGPQGAEARVARLATMLETRFSLAKEPT